MAKKKALTRDAAREQSLQYTIAQISRKCGDGAIMILGQEAVREFNTISTGSLALDVALGIGGVPRGRVTEIYGPESSGKTTLALHILANAQKNHGVAAFIDAEHALDPSYAKRLGVDIDSLLVSQPDSGEQALEITDMLVASNAVDVVVVDSVAALVPRAELEGEMGDSHVGLQARLMSQALRKLTSSIHKTNTCVIFINQIREKIGVMFGSPETTSGGRALKFYSSIRIDIRRRGSIKDGDKIIGNVTKAKVVKNKCAPPFRVAEFDIYYNKGIHWVGDILELGVEFGVINKSGSWYSYGETRLGQGKERSGQFLTENQAILVDIENEVLSKAFPERPPRKLEAVEEKKQNGAEKVGSRKTAKRS